MRVSTALGSAPAPTVVFFHGGGWVAGDLETHDRQARNLAIETGAPSSSPSTTAARRRHAFPARSRTPLRRQATSSTASQNLAAMQSGSALPVTAQAGNLAAATAIACRDAGIKLAAQLLVYPVTDVAGS